MSNPLVRTIAVLRRDRSAAAIRAVIETVRDVHPEDAVVAAELAHILASSGESLQPGTEVSADVASTGGPSSLSTLLSPLYLRAAGAVVPKLGVPGRPAGGIDCLAQVPNYRTTLSSVEATAVLRSGGYVHFLASEKLAPLDADMFRIRQQLSAQSVPTLVAASLLGKKLALGVKYVGLDIRVAPHGNFGKDWLSASRNARLFIEAARRLGIEAVAILTDARYPYQPYIGRAEALVALGDLFDGTASPWLQQHCATCRDLAIACLPNNLRRGAMNADAADLKRHFERNIVDQGSQFEFFESVVQATKGAHRIDLVARHAGFCNFALAGLRDTLVFWQRQMESDKLRFPDPVGIILKQPPGSWVEKGDVIATLRTPVDKMTEILDALAPLICTPSHGLQRTGVEAIYE